MGDASECVDRCDDIEAQGRIDLAACYRLCHYYGLNEGVCNHLSLMVDEKSFLVIKHGQNWDEVTPDSLLLVDESGAVLKGDGQCESTAFYIHSRIHAGGAQCVLHTHMPWSTALCCLENGRLEMCHQNCLRFYNDIAYDSQFNGLVLDESEGDRLWRVMDGRKVLFHANHGVIVVGKSVAEAFDDLYYLERAAEVVVKAMSTGRPLKILDKQTCEDYKKQHEASDEAAPSVGTDLPPLPSGADALFSALKRKLQRGWNADVPFP